MTTYVHNLADRILYEFPDQPTVSEETDKRGLRLGWVAEMQISITRPDNNIIGSQWKYAIMDIGRAHYPAHYSRIQVIDSFRLHHEPRGESIPETQFKVLKVEYENAANGRTGI